MSKLRLNISYLGTAYCGWQVQPHSMSVQQRLQDAIEDVYGKRYAITGCSRTDSGVHAENYYCTVGLDSEAPHIPLDRLPTVINNKLPSDIAVKYADTVPENFHPRYSCIGKEYEYRFHDSGIRDPFSEGRVTYSFSRLDEEKMDIAAKTFIGKHDFVGFMAKGSKITDTVRTVYTCSVRRSGSLVILRIGADGFLYNMVRIIAGTLLKVGRGECEVGKIPDIIASKDRKNAGQTMPPQGLFLVSVNYPKGKEFDK